MLGGREDLTYNFGLTWLPSDGMQVDLGYYNTDLKRESQPVYIINGVREVAKFQATPFSDMNFNEVTLSTLSYDQGGPFSLSKGNTLWRGRIPLDPGQGAWVGSIDANGDPVLDWGYGAGQTAEDPRVLGQSDPRGFGFKAQTEIYSLGFAWDINDVWSAKYNYGYINHDGIQQGPADRDVLFGSNLVDLNNDGSDRADAYMQTNGVSSRPIIELFTESHEVRFEWAASEALQVNFGGFYSRVDDEQYDRTNYAPICTTPDRLLDQDQDPTEACYVPINELNYLSPLNQVEKVGIYDIFANVWSGNKGNWTHYDDKITSAFASIQYDITSDVTILVEGRYTKEDKSVERFSDDLAIRAGETASGFGSVTGLIEIDSSVCAPSDNDNPNCIPSEDQRNFYYFTPKVNIDWRITEDNFIYAYAANGLKAGGFNNTSVRRQSTFNAEENWTYEIGSKNTLLDGFLQLNAAVYLIDWTDLVGGQAPITDGGFQSPNANTAQANIGDVENYGMEIDGRFIINDSWEIDFGAAYTNPRYKDGVKYDAAKRYYHFECTEQHLKDDRNADGSSIGGNFNSYIDPGELCGNDDIGGNDLSKVSKQQYNWGVNYNTMVGDWDVSFRLDGNYQSRQWVDLLNQAYIPSRTIWNANLNVFSGPWEVTVWGKNIFDKEYVSGTFTLALFNKYIVSYGAPATFGTTIKYNF
ncbi:TonB-dependent receptor domain-containing protein [Oceanicoccus sp. KOV_DT_Chl]|uniref:TonB-dependent receptor domain-containing protein n=1 Tax=Oceanicoccus sp. KOV_DT_Chl TaxID=1904639 RepID=UPI000C7B91B8|nr:TonB-dependent receptor [Oceanicoccus sp. KOV_DT_Chl]